MKKSLEGPKLAEMSQRDRQRARMGIQSSPRSLKYEASK